MDKVKKVLYRIFIDGLSGMAMGLFATLIIGTIISTIGGYIPGDIGKFIVAMGTFAKAMMGAGIGIGMAYKLKKAPMVSISAGVAGMIGAWADQLIVGGGGYALITDLMGSKASPGNPIGAYVVAMLVVELVELYAGKTKLDIILIPIGALLIAFVGIFVSWPFIKLIDLFAKLLVITISAGAAVKVIIGILMVGVHGTKVANWERVL